MDEITSTTALMLMFTLGLRHGIDPDHIACIDGLTWRALSRSHGHEPHRHPARWVGSLFATGHGLLVTVIAVGVGQISHSFDVPASVVQVFGWIPTMLLVLVGSMNLRLLLSEQDAYAPTGWKMRLIPRRLREQSSPWAIVLIGVLFATVFDTATQASAWGYIAADKGGGAWSALVAGLVFTAGMITTDTLDGRLVCRIGRDTAHFRGGVYRRRLGWLIVGISYAVATYNIGKALFPWMELDDVAFSIAGVVLVAVMLVVLSLGVVANRRVRRRRVRLRCATDPRG